MIDDPKELIKSQARDPTVSEYGKYVTKEINEALTMGTSQD